MRQCAIFWTKNNVRRTRNGRHQKQTESSMGSIPQVQTRAHFESISPLPQTTLVQHGNHANVDISKWDVDLITKTRKNDQDRTTKDASPHRPDKEKIHIEEQKKEAPEATAKETGKQKEKNAIARLMKKLMKVRSNKDQDSGVSFQEDNDEETDNTEKKNGLNTSREVPWRQKKT